MEGSAWNKNFRWQAIAAKIQPALEFSAKREGITFNTDFQSSKQIAETLTILSKSEAKEYLPDIIVTRSSIHLAEGLYKEQKEWTESFQAYTLHKGKHFNLSKRILTTIRNDKFK